jgi:hypothetical protein
VLEKDRGRFAWRRAILPRSARCKTCTIAIPSLSGQPDK